MAVSASAEMRLLPEDEAERDLSFVQFREQLKQVIAARDSDKLLTLIDDEISVSARKRGSVKTFVSTWQPESPDSELWPVLDTILSLGGGFVRSELGVKFCAPYVFTNFPGGLDVYGHGVVIHDKEPFKSAPTKNSQTLSLLSYDILKVEDWRSVVDSVDPKTRWLKVRDPEGREGYVNKKSIRSPSDYAACFLHTPNDGWRMISLIGNE